MAIFISLGKLNSHFVLTDKKQDGAIENRNKGKFRKLKVQLTPFHFIPKYIYYILSSSQSVGYI